MHAIRRQLLAFVLPLLVALSGTGCGWARAISWDLPPRDQPRDAWPGVRDYEQQREQDADSLKDIREERAQKEAEFLRANPGARR